MYDSHGLLVREIGKFDNTFLVMTEHTFPTMTEYTFPTMMEHTFPSNDIEIEKQVYAEAYC
jgi:hypothetical protein